ncbi:VWA domain-containing protein [bacterium]|nr:VWA domain-containing protein [bacterium]
MLEWIPDRPALTHDQACTLDVLVRITPPQTVRGVQRLPLNLALVIDRSGSMQGVKIDLTKKAAALVTQSLRPDDHLSVVLFNNAVVTLIPSRRVGQPEEILRQLQTIEAGGGTALYDGWQSGAAQATLSQTEQNLNRVILLTDGQANVGETRTDTICDQVHRLGQRGVQTTTMGFGGDYNEGLLRSMAASGEGNHFYVQSPEQLGPFFELELDGLAATVGTRVRLNLIAADSEVRIEPLGEVQRSADGEFLLADLVDGFPLEQLFRISVPASGSAEPCLRAELRWYSPASASHQTADFPLLLPRVSAQERLDMAVDPEVGRHLAIAMAARARREASAAADRGDRVGAAKILEQVLQEQPLSDVDKGQLEKLRLTFERGDLSAASKQSAAYSHSYSRGSVSMSNLDEIFMEGVLGSVIRLKASDFFSQEPGPHPRAWLKVEGMLGGLLAGEAQARPAGAPRGEHSELALATLALIKERNKLVMLMLPLAKALAAAPVAEPSGDFVAFREQVALSSNFMECGVETPSAAALARIAPLLLARWRSPGAASWSFVTVGAHVTHRDGATAAANVAFVALLWAMLARPDPPGARAYLELYLKVLQRVELEAEYSARQPRFDGWKGKLSDFLTAAIPDARRRSLEFGEAIQEWGTSDYVLETVPSLLYLLECHGHQPRQALEEAARVSPLLGALAGAALGALHGVIPGCQPQGELATMLGDLQQSLGAN